MKRFLFFSIFIVLMPVATNAAALTPAIMEITAERGEVVEQTLTVINAKAIDQTYFLGVMKFEPSAEGGIPKFIPFEEDHTGLPEWIQLPFSEFVVKKNSKQEVQYTVSIPSDVKSGGYYAAVTVSESPSDLVADNGAIVEAKTAALVLLTVSGAIEEKLALLEFKTTFGRSKSNVDGPYEFRLQNQGNVHVTPSGAVSVKDIFGRIVAKFDANPTSSRVLPNSTRQFVTGSEMQNNLYKILKDQMRIFAIGPMVAELALIYGESEQTITSSFGFWYVPWQIMVTDVLLIVLIILLFSLAHKRK